MIDRPSKDYRGYDEPHYQAFFKEHRFSRWRWGFSTPNEDDLVNSFKGWGRGQAFTSHYAIKVIFVEGRVR